MDTAATHTVSGTVVAATAKDAEDRAYEQLDGYFDRGDYSVTFTASPHILSDDGTTLRWEVEYEAVGTAPR